MKLFLTSAGLSNEKLVDAFEGLVGLPNEDKIEVVSEGNWEKFN